MARLILILIIIFLVAFVIQQSHVFETTKIMDARLGVTTDQYRVNWDNLYKYLIGVAAILAVIMIIWGGLEISTQDSVSKNKDGKERIYNAIFGLVLVLSPVLVFSIINPSILNLSLNLPPLNTTTVTGGGSGAMNQTTDPPPVTGCTTTHTGPYLETAICANQNDANSYSCKN